MKKIIVVFSIFILLFVTGCGNTVSELNVDNTKSIIESDLKNMQEVDEDSLKDVYGLNLDLMEVHIIKQNTEGDLYAIIKTNEKSKVKNDMTKYFEKVNESPRACLLFNKVTDALDTMGQSLNQAEKRQVLMRVLETLCGGED